MKFAAIVFAFAIAAHAQVQCGPKDGLFKGTQTFQAGVKIPVHLKASHVVGEQITVRLISMSDLREKNREIVALDKADTGIFAVPNVPAGIYEYKWGDTGGCIVRIISEVK